MVVVAQAVVPHDYGSNSNSGNAATTVPTSITNAAQLPEFLQRLLPEHCPTATAAKRAIRRRLILRIPGFATHGSVASANDGMSGIPPHPAGVVATMTDAVTPGEVLQLLARRGTGIMGWVGVGAMRPAAAAAAADAAARGNTEINTNMTSAAVVAAPARAACTGAVIIEGDDQTGRGTGISWLQGLPVAYEDEHMAVVIKPPGIETQGPGSETVHGRLKYCLRPTTLVGALNRPQQVHRLDASTGGLLLVAKTHHALRVLAADLRQRRMIKRYCALIKGELSGSGTINKPLSGKPCSTSFRVVRTAEASATAMVPMTYCTTAAIANGALATPPATGCNDAAAVVVAAAAASIANGRRQHRTLSKVLLWPHTGRTHQLRKHMAYLGTPILGDPRYRTVARSIVPDRCAAAADLAAAAADDSGIAGGICCSAAAVVSSTFLREEEISRNLEPEGEFGLSGAQGGMKDEEPVVNVSAAAGRPEGAPINAEISRSCLHTEHEAGKEVCEVHRPPANVGWVLAVAAAAAAAAAAAEMEGSGSSSSCDVDVLADGSPVSLCLWAVGLRFRHPDSGRNVEVDISEWADVVYEEILRRDTAIA
ncbi:hypothetical protein Vretimale_9737 [Volvox reticuliferus]|nr:hypothetical protein Vretifemale_13489 [Volvox reticuliferus]GIM05284.1 hypothetical protein Vretimale_9737 [Volvox reticuliferus]